MSEWGETQLSRIAKLRSGFPFKSSSWVDDGVPVIKIANIKDGRIVADGCGYVSHETATIAQEWMTQKGDILIAMTGYVGEIARVRSGEKYLINQRVGRFDFLDDAPVIPEFFFYYLRQLEVRSLLETMARGSAQPNLSANDVAKLRVPVPPLPEQRAIAHILGTLDDKIELGRKQNETLEAMARTLFKAWFVDFEPVRAKLEGRWQRGQSLPGLPAHLYDLFPDRLVDSELGEIPEGWGLGKIQDFCESITSGGTPARKQEKFWQGGNIPWFKTGELNDGPLLDSEEKITEAALRGSACKLWPAGTLLFALYASPTVGRLGLLTSPGTSNQAAAGLIAKKSVGVPFLRRTLLEARDRLQNIAVGAAQQNINLGILKSHPIVNPPECLIARYSLIAAKWDDQQVEIAHESRTLAQLRDTLLPKLISGELRIKDAEAFLKERGL